MRTYGVYRTIALALARIAAWVTNAAGVMQRRAERQLRMMRYVYREEEHGKNDESETTRHGNNGAGIPRTERDGTPINGYFFSRDKGWKSTAE